MEAGPDPPRLHHPSPLLRDSPDNEKPALQKPTTVNKLRRYASQPATRLMTAYVVATSFAPLLVALGAGETPFIFSAAWGAGEVAGLSPILLLRFREIIFSREARKAVISQTLCLAMFLWTINSLWIAAYAWSTRFIDVAVAAALFETWPVFLVILTARLFRTEARYRKITKRTLLFFGIAILGIIFVFASEAGGFVSPTSLEKPANLAAGVGLTLLAVALASLSAYGFRWAADLAKRLSDLPKLKKRSKSELETFGAFTGMAASNLAASPAVAALGFARGEYASPSALLWGASGGAAIGVSSILWRMANLLTDDLGINAMNYLIPALALIWLFAFRQVGAVSAAHLIAGLALIIAANIGAAGFSKTRA